MGCDTIGRIKGFVSHEAIMNYIYQKWDKNVTTDVSKQYRAPLSEVTWKHKVNRDDDNGLMYKTYGNINFSYNGEMRNLFYAYDNVNHLENLEYYKDLGLEDMVLSETTYLNLSAWGSSVEMIQELVAHFGGGWVHDNDCGDKNPYPVEPDGNGGIKPVIYVTRQELYDKFGGIVVIKD